MINSARLLQRRPWKHLQDSHPDWSDQDFLDLVMRFFDRIEFKHGEVCPRGSDMHGVLTRIEVEEIDKEIKNAIERLKGLFIRLKVEDDTPLVGFDPGEAGPTFFEILNYFENYFDHRIFLSAFAVQKTENSWVTSLARRIFYEFSYSLQWHRVTDSDQHAFIKGLIREFASANDLKMPEWERKKWRACRDSYFTKVSQHWSLKDFQDIFVS